jgi:exonuclease SbcD
MLALHTSDWHLGRGLHGHDLIAAQAAFVDHLVDVVRSEGVDVVLVAGDVHDRAIPPVVALELFDEALSRLRDTGARVVVISGNHDAARRLGDKSGLLDPRIRIRTDPAAVGDPVVLEDAAGPIRVYPIPYLEPTTANSRLPEPPDASDAEASANTVEAPEAWEGPVAPAAPAVSDLAGTARATGTTRIPGIPGSTGTAETPEISEISGRAPAMTQAATMRRAMRGVRADLRRHPTARSIVMAHAWVTGGTGSDSERDISLGGVGNVPMSLFDGITYTALGHLHRPQAIAPAVRYSGSPVAYSFSEAHDTKASLLVEIGRDGLAAVRRIDVPAGRRMALLRGTLAELLSSPAHAGHEQDFVSAVLTDPVRPVEAMATLQRRFPFALRLSHEPTDTGNDERTFGQRTRGRSELEIAKAFVAHVRSTPSARERDLLAEALDAARQAEEAA